MIFAGVFEFDLFVVLLFLFVSWYWGDFFFRKDSSLTFDGIFELFPHPMYTVGYSLYYGYSLILRSYTMLFVSLIAHMMQLLFLVCVEEPHIERIYGTPPKIDQTKLKVLYDSKNGLFPEKKDSIFLSHFDLFRTGDFGLALLTIYSCLFCWLAPFSYTIIQVIIWRIVHWCGLGGALWAQSERQVWTRHFTTKGRTLHEVTKIEAM
jgi:phosphatidylethanolamine N-methyltransferase